MNAVGRLGSYISRGVYSVSAPFHPFGGAVDIIVVEQLDGSFKSSPWYVRFGKFQGVLKSKENIVKISVNGVEANFHMHLNNTGQAHFLREVDDDEVEDRTEPAIRTSSSVEEMKNYSQDYKKSLKSKSCDFGAVLDSAQGGPGFDRFNSLQCSEVAAQHLEVQWTTSLATNACKDADEVSHCSAPGSLEDDKYDSDMQVCHEMNLSHKKEDITTDDQQGIDEGDVSFLSRNSSEETLTDRVQCLSCVRTTETEDITLEKLAEDIKKKEEEDSQQTTVSHACDETDLEGSTTTLLSFDQSVSLDRLSVSDREDFVDGNLFRGQQFTSESSLENQFLFSDLDEPKLNERRLSVSSRFSDGIESVCTKDDACVTPDTSDNENQSTNAGHFHGEPRAILKPINGERRQRTGSGKMIGLAESVPNMPSHFDSFNARDTDNSLNQSLSLKSHSLKLPLPRNDKRSTKPCARKENQIMQTRPSPEGNANSIMGEGANLPEPKVTKKTVEVLTPTSEQISSLNLKEGGNAVTLTFCTEMLGDQQVDARIYLWKWNAQIIISDVDGTITKSDILGQCMPLVGIDWSQAGVARLFQAVKENGYELLFLSARSISQAHITRQFLVNLKQDGMALPDGPVLISPDGLFPSLYREVIKRAPHEFKIACLEDIKALFPSDHSPFYAGFGNRDTDEISYLKVGIPKGKIFIINPKGEVVVNRHVHTKSYTSIHGLVNGMFPPVTSSEQEDFNSWNFWRLPPTNMNL